LYPFVDKFLAEVLYGQFQSAQNLLGIISNKFLLMQGLTNLKTLRLESLPDMSCIWKGTLEVIYLDKN
jgi:hypothetical protein